MKSNLLITGGLGFIGSHTVLNFLLNSDSQIIIVDNLSNSKISTLAILESLAQQKVKYYQVDVGDYDQIKAVLQKEEITSVIHFAAAKSVSDSIKHPQFYYQNNITALLVLLKAMQECEVKQFIFSSSATVYHQSNIFPVTEESQLGYLNPYGQTKLIGEDILIREHRQTGLNVGILRYFNPLGNESSGRLGERLSAGATNIMPMLLKAIQNQKPFCIYGHDYSTQDGTPIRDYIHVEDLASAHRAMSEHLDQHHGCFIFNVGLGVGVSVLELVNRFSQVNDIAIPIEFKQRRLGDLPICFADTQKIQQHFTWRPQYHLNDMCRDAFTFFKNNYGS